MIKKTISDSSLLDVLKLKTVRDLLGSIPALNAVQDLHIVTTCEKGFNSTHVYRFLRDTSLAMHSTKVPIDVYFVKEVVT